MKAQEIRQSFVEHFRARDHKSVPSSPLVPHGDPTLLFVNAGMVPFKNVFLGAEEPPAARAVSVQKCLRVSGKHNDLESVGPSARHHTFFEMLGNFSFGDYFKEEAIRSAWELVTKTWEMPEEHLYATVFEDDDEAERLWRELTGLPAERVVRCGAKDNFWAMGATGPCGPSSELHIDLAPHLPKVDWDEGAESGRYFEFWNLVFMQYDRDDEGKLHLLPDPSIDTGAGLERVAAILQGADSNYGTDLFRPIFEAAAEIAGVGADGASDNVSLRVIADHLRAVSFLLADGVIPGNEGRGYVLRRILRRAVRHGMRLGFEEPFLHRLVPVLGEAMGDAYPELEATRDASVVTIQAEEEKFLGTVASGARQVQEEIEAARERGLDQLPGESAFRLYDTHGLPVEVIREIAEEERMGFDDAGFAAELERQRERSRSAGATGQKRLAEVSKVLRASDDSDDSDDDESLDVVQTEGSAFVGYDQASVTTSRVLRLVKEENDAALLATALGEGERGVVVLDRTPFYAESGGQVGDVGRLSWDGGHARVTDTKKDSAGSILHLVEVVEGILAREARVEAAIDAARRAWVERNHTATHLLHAALREVLGETVRQAGSLVAPDRLRFDFTFSRPVEDDELERIESKVNGWILDATPVEIAERSHQEAVAAGAMALFGEKYGDRVRTVSIPGSSLELCGGCHVGSTGEIGLFLVLAERGIASGVRRIEAVTGEGALERVRRQRELLEEIEEAAQSSAERVADEITTLKKRLAERDDELAKLRLEMIAGTGSGGESGTGTGDGDDVREVSGIPVMAREVPMAPAGELRNMADTLRSRLGSGVVVIGARGDGKVTLIAAVTDDLTDRVKAGELVRRLAPLVGGGGGGRPDFAQAGGKETERLDEALEAAADAVGEQLT